jgi:hypothetical protein
MCKTFNYVNFRRSNELNYSSHLMEICMSLKKLIGCSRFVIGLGTALALIQSVALAEPVKLTAEQAIEQIFRSDTPLPGSTEAEHQNLIRERTRVLGWLGSYQGVRQARNGRSIIVFERGSLPVKVIFRKNGEPDALTANECPTTSIPISQAPSDWRKELSRCGDLTP